MKKISIALIALTACAFSSCSQLPYVRVNGDKVYRDDTGLKYTVNGESRYRYKYKTVKEGRNRLTVTDPPYN